jgi:hypothetical protein
MKDWGAGKERPSFLKKRSKKLLLIGPEAHGRQWPAHKFAKVFLLLFLQKKKNLLHWAAT